MLLSKTAQYALRAMTQLASLPAGDWMRAADLAVQTKVPRNYLSKILRKLVEAGLLESEKGHHGGFRLARAGHRIKLVEVFKAVDEELNLKACAFDWGRCDAENPCLLHPIYSKLTQTVNQWAEGMTLAAQAAPAPRRRRQ